MTYMKRALSFVVATVLAVALAGCPKPLPPPPPPPSGPATCADVCQRMSQLGCPGAQATAEGATCLDVCRNVQESEIGTWDLDCRARASSCEAADACEVSR